MRARLLLILCIGGWASVLCAQNKETLFLLAHERPVLSARMAGAGNSFGAIGQESGAFGSQPASIGTVNELVADLSVGVYSTRRGISQNPFVSTLNLASIVVPFYPSFTTKSKWKSVVAGLSYQFLNRYRAYVAIYSDDFFSNALLESQGKSPQQLDPYGTGFLYEKGVLLRDRWDNQF